MDLGTAESIERRLINIPSGVATARGRGAKPSTGR
jgi:hypothetical protein